MAAPKHRAIAPCYPPDDLSQGAGTIPRADNLFRGRLGVAETV